MCVSFVFGQSTPTNLTSTQITDTSALLQWNKGTCGNSYQLRVKELNSSFFNPVGGAYSSSAATVTYNLSGLAPNTTYVWRVKCNGPNTWVYDTLTTLQTASQPTNLVITIGNTFSGGGEASPPSDPP